MLGQTISAQRERAERTAAVYRRVVRDGGRPSDAIAALMDFWCVDHPRAGGFLWEAGALGLIPQFYGRRAGHTAPEGDA